MMLDIRLIQRIFAMKITKIFYRRNGLKAIKSSESKLRFKSGCHIQQSSLTNEKDKAGH